MARSIAASRVSTHLAQPRWLAAWLVAGWLGGVAAVYLHYPEYRSHWPDCLVMAWARGVIPVSIVLLSVQLALRVFARDELSLLVGLPFGAVAYWGFIWLGTRVLPFWLSDAMITLVTGVMAGSLPVAVLWIAHCKHGPGRS
jgi:hypothetical protein